MTLALPALVGDGIENPHNALTMTHAARLFGWSCHFRDRAGLAEGWPAELGPIPSWVDTAGLEAGCSGLLALDNAEGAVPIYGHRPGKPSGLGLVVGNERRGIAPDLLRAARERVVVPMASRRVNTLNVAAASAVGLYYLSRGGGGKQFVRSDPNAKRPELLLLGGDDHLELGSTIRSAAAFGWRRAFVEDRGGVWFGCDRVTRSEGRAAARRGKNEIRLVPTASDRTYAFEQACVVSLSEGQPLARTNLARGPRQLVVLADESHVRCAAEETVRLAREVRIVRVETPQAAERVPYHFRVVATIALAEVARQVGVRAPKGRRRPRPPIYERALEVLLEEAGEAVTLDELADY